MSTITLPNIRVSSDLTVKVRLKDGGVAIDWSTLSNIRALIYSDAQSSLAGRCDVTVDGEDATLLVCRYAATRMQYLGVNRIVVSAKYMGATKTYDKPVLNFVRWTEDQAGEQITIEDPEVTVEIDVEDISSSILQEAVDAAFTAADRANDAAAAAEHMADIHQGPPGPAGKAPYVDATTGNWFVWDDTEEAYVDSGNPAQGPAGNGIASWIVAESQEDGGINVVTVTFTDGTSETFTYKNGSTGATPNLVMGIVTTGDPGSQAEAQITGTPANPVLHLKIPQGEPGVAAVRYIQVDTLPSASSHTLDALYLVPTNTADVYDVYYTSRDGQTYSWVQLCTTSVQLSDYATKAEVTQLEAEVNGLSRTIVTDIINNKIADKTVTTLGVNAFVTDIELKSGKSYLIYVKSPGAVDNSNTGVWIKVGNTYTKIESLTASQYYDGVYLEYTPDSDCLLCVRPYAVTTVLIKVWDLSIPATLASLNESEIINSIASEAFQFSSFVYADGLVSSATIKWSDGVVGTMSITYTNGLPTSVSYTHGTDTYVQTITYASDGSVASTSIAKQ